MKKSLIISIFLFLTIFPEIVRADNQIPEVVINEIQISGGIKKTKNSFIELKNTTLKSINLTNWKLRKITGSGINPTSIKSFNPSENKNIIIPPGGYLLWSNAEGDYLNLTLPEFINSSTLYFNYSIGLFDENETLIDSITYGEEHVNTFLPTITYPANPPINTSLERNLSNNYFYEQTNPSPQNNAFLEEELIEDDENKTEKPSKINDLKIRINEVFPNPSAKGEDNEYIEIFNFGDNSINISKFILKDASRSSKYTFPQNSILDSEKFLVIYKESSKISLNNTEEKIYLLDDDENLIDFLEYSETKEESSYSFDEIENKFRWSKNLTPGKTNAFDPAPEGKEKIPKKSYKNFPTEFSTSGSSNYDYSWNFGDGGRSTKQKTTHIYKETGIFKGFLIINNGTEEKKIDFEIKIEKYPKKSIDIIGVLPNPEGSDSDSEYIILKNNDKKSIDLSDWSIATGSNKNKLTNHPFTKSITLKNGEEKIIYNKYSNFSLPNQKGFIELRQPDSKNADKISYSKEKSIGENELYKLGIDKKWHWTNQPLTIKDETESEDGNEKEIKFANLSDEEKEKIIQEIKEKLREEIYNEITVEFEGKREENQSVLGEEKIEENVKEKESFILEIKKSLKNILLATGLYFENIFK